MELNSLYCTVQRTSLVAQLVKNPPAIQETWIHSLGWEDTLEKGKATHFSILAWRIYHGLYSPRGRQTGLSDFHCAKPYIFSANLIKHLCFKKNYQNLNKAGNK